LAQDFGLALRKMAIKAEQHIKTPEISRTLH
jgi:hypothetical protein